MLLVRRVWSHAFWLQDKEWFSLPTNLDWFHGCAQRYVRYSTALLKRVRNDPWFRGRCSHEAFMDRTVQQAFKGSQSSVRQFMGPQPGSCNHACSHLASHLCSMLFLVTLDMVPEPFAIKHTGEWTKAIAFRYLFSPVRFVVIWENRGEWVLQWSVNSVGPIDSNSTLKEIEVQCRCGITDRRIFQQEEVH